uniref:Uncharacterized protein n=1 Tax=Brassica campestris TaxID=3711 RepID=A0A3P5Z5D5_BRACM|nr:unnamed protein product [Brassica rapa]
MVVQFIEQDMGQALVHMYCSNLAFLWFPNMVRSLATSNFCGEEEEEVVVL